MRLLPSYLPPPGRLEGVVPLMDLVVEASVFAAVAVFVSAVVAVAAVAVVDADVVAVVSVVAAASDVVFVVAPFVAACDVDIVVGMLLLLLLLLLLLFILMFFFQLFIGKSCLPFLATIPSKKSTTSTNLDYCIGCWQRPATL